MKTGILRLSAVLLLAQALSADDLPTMVENSGSKEIDALVAELVSRRPHPFPPSGRIPEHFHDKQHIEMLGNYITQEVANAIEKLEHLGPSASPFLLAHIEDNRYCYSTTMPSAVGSYGDWLMVTVGEAVRDVITGGFESGGLYKWRDGPDKGGFSPPDFSDYVKTQGGLKKWVAANSKKSKTEVFTKFIDWCISTERVRGFRTKDDELQLLARYEEWKQKIEQ